MKTLQIKAENKEKTRVLVPHDTWKLNKCWVLFNTEGFQFILGKYSPTPRSRVAFYPICGGVVVLFNITDAHRDEKKGKKRDGSHAFS